MDYTINPKQLHCINAALQHVMACFLASLHLLLPKAVLAGPTLVMFASIAVANVKILTTAPIDRRKSLNLATSIGLGLGVMMVPETLSQLPPLVANIFSSSATVADFCAILMSLLIPDYNSEAPTTPV
jgi:xanthine permease XanP